MKTTTLVKGSQGTHGTTKPGESYIAKPSETPTPSIPSTKSAEPVTTYYLVDAASMTLIDDSARDLLKAQKESSIVQEKVIAAVSIEKLIRLKFDIAKHER
jgi:hypothetical protein